MESPVAPFEDTGLPGLRSWRAVYFAVGGVFIIWIVLLTALTRLYPAAS